MHDTDRPDLREVVSGNCVRNVADRLRGGEPIRCYALIGRMAARYAGSLTVAGLRIAPEVCWDACM